MTFYEFCEICNFNEDPEIYVIGDNLSETYIDWNRAVNKYVSKDYEYIYDDDEEIIGVKAEIVISEDELQDAIVLGMDVDRCAKIRVRL